MRLQRSVGVCALALFAQAAPGADQGFYFGLFGGRADYEFDEPALQAGFIPGGITTNPPLLPPGDAVIGVPSFVTGVAVSALVRPLFWVPGGDDEATAWGALVGYRVMRHFAAELSYANLGTLQDSRPIIVPPILGGTRTLHRELETKGPSVSALGILPISEQWEVYLRAGVLFADMELSSSIDGLSSGSSTFGSETLLWGAGTQFNWGDHWAVRLDFQRFDGVGSDNDGEADIDLLSLGVLYRL